MSLSKAVTHSGSRGFAALVALSMMVSACADGSGFRPLYGNVGAMTSAEGKLASVETATIPGRTGQRIRNELIFQTTSGDKPPPAVYRLEVVIKESLLSTLVERDGNAASQVYSLDATFRLVNIGDNKVLLQGSSFGRAGFERFTSVLANVRAQEDAQNRAAKTVANDIKGRIAAFLSRPT